MAHRCDGVTERGADDVHVLNLRQRPPTLKEARSRKHPNWPILKLIPRPSRDPSTGEIPALDLI